MHGRDEAIDEEEQVVFVVEKTNRCVRIWTMMIISKDATNKR